MGSSGWVHLDVEIIEGETEKALWVRLKNRRDHWIPLSLIADSDNYKKGDRNCTISVKEWFCEKEGIKND